MLDANEYLDGNVESIGSRTETLWAAVRAMAPGAHE